MSKNIHGFDIIPSTAANHRRLNKGPNATGANFQENRHTHSDKTVSGLNLGRLFYEGHLERFYLGPLALGLASGPEGRPKKKAGPDRAFV